MYFVFVMLINAVWLWHVFRDGVISTVTVDGARYVVITTVVGAMVVMVVVKSEKVVAETYAVKLFVIVSVSVTVMLKQLVGS